MDIIDAMQFVQEQKQKDDGNNEMYSYILNLLLELNTFRWINGKTA